MLDDGFCLTVLQCDKLEAEEKLFHLQKMNHCLKKSQTLTSSSLSDITKRQRTIL